jgi:hypothetical protein
MISLYNVTDGRILEVDNQSYFLVKVPLTNFKCIFLDSREKGIFVRCGQFDYHLSGHRFKPVTIPDANSDQKIAKWDQNPLIVNLENLGFKKINDDDYLRIEDDLMKRIFLVNLKGNQIFNILSSVYPKDYPGQLIGYIPEKEFFCYSSGNSKRGLAFENVLIMCYYERKLRERESPLLIKLS